MSLENFQVPPFLVQELYNDSLVDLENSQLIKKSLEAVDLSILGGNQKNVLIIVDEEDALYLPDEALNFLLDILAACKLSIPDISLINFDKNPGVNYKILIERFNPGKIICFGIDLSALAFPLEFPHYQVQNYNRQIYLAAPSLKQLATDKQEKLKLWGCLKSLFSI